MSDRYPKEWSDYPSVTEILGIIAKPGLIRWFKNTSPEEIKATSGKACNVGTVVNEIIDKMDEGVDLTITTQYPEEVKMCVQNYVKWKTENNMVLISSQGKMLNKEFGYKGTYDRLAKMNGKLILIDWKTSKKLWLDNKMQLVAYKKAYEHMHNEKIDELWLVRIGKTEVAFETHMIPNETHNELFKHFLQALDLYNLFSREDKETSNGVQN